MRASTRFPSGTQLHNYWQGLGAHAHTYEDQGATRTGLPPQGYDYDINRICLGQGQQVYEAAVISLRDWRMFPPSWTVVFPDKVPLIEGKDVVVLFRLFGMWWFNGCRIVYPIHEKNRFGFAYGTLEGHVERGEEQFLVYRDDQDQVWYQITAFSKPGVWLTKLGYPVARRLQRRFVQQSMQCMQQSTKLTADAFRTV